MSLMYLLPLFFGLAFAVERHPTVAEAQHNGNQHHHKHSEKDHSYTVDASAKVSNVHADHSGNVPAPKVVRREHLHSHTNHRDEEMSLLSSGNVSTIQHTYSSDAKGDAPKDATGAFGTQIVPDHDASMNTPANINEAEKELEKLDKIIQGAELEADLPDSTQTTPEPYTTAEEEQMEEETMLGVIAILLIVLACLWGAAWIVFYQRFYAPAASKAVEEQADGGEGEGEALLAGETTGTADY